MARLKSAFQYHNLSSYERHRMSGHYLDWQNQPIVYKEYPGIDIMPLPQDIRPPKGKLSSILKERAPDHKTRAMNIKDLSLILSLTYSLSAKARYAGGDFYYRTAASAGALYPTEIYVAAHGVGGLDDGLYHFAIHRHGLSPLRTDDLSQHIVRLTPLHEGTAPTMTFFFTAILFRSAWKYRDRAYRYHLLDTGHVIENMVLALKALQLPCDLSYDFDDEKANHLLGLDEEKEISLAVVHVPGVDPIAESEGQVFEELPESIRHAGTVSGKEIDYPLIGEQHEAGAKIISSSETGPNMIHELGLIPDSLEKESFSSHWPEVMDYHEALFTRRSSRNFIREEMRKESLMALLESLCLEEHSDLEGGGRPPYDRSVCTGIIVGKGVEEVSPGLYLLDTSEESTGLVRSGSFMDIMSHICLDQAWLAHASVHVLFLSNLDLLDRTWGVRGYRYAMMTAGRMGERLYIASTALGMGCCGIGAYYDRDAAELIGLNKESSLLYLVAVGPVKSLLGR